MIPIETREGYIPVTGGRVWYQIVGSGDATPLLVLHGGPGVPHDYLEPLADLASERPVIFMTNWAVASRSGLTIGRFGASSVLPKKWG